MNVTQPAVRSLPKAGRKLNPQVVPAIEILVDLIIQSWIRECMAGKVHDPIVPPASTQVETACNPQPFGTQ